MTLFNRAVRAASVAVAAALAFSPLLSGPAAATGTHPAALSGDAACVPGGGWKATWTFTNRSPLAVEVVKVDGPLTVAVPLTVAAGADVSDSAEIPATTTSATLTVTYRLVRPVDVKTSEPEPFVVRETINRCSCPTTAPTTTPPTPTTPPTATPTTTAPTVPTTAPTTLTPTTTRPTTDTPTTTAPTTQPTTASPTTTATVPPVTGGTGTGGGDEDSLPLTGPSLIVFGTVGIAAVLAGAGALWLSRRRARFTA